MSYHNAFQSYTLISHNYKESASFNILHLVNSQHSCFVNILYPIYQL